MAARNSIRHYHGIIHTGAHRSTSNSRLANVLGWYNIVAINFIFVGCGFWRYIIDISCLQLGSGGVATISSKYIAYNSLRHAGQHSAGKYQSASSTKRGMKF